MIGKSVRMERIMDRHSGKTVIVPMDHGVTIGPISGLVRIEKTIHAVSKGGANAVVVHKGLMETCHRGATNGLGRIVHLSAGTRMMSDSNCKIMVCTVEEAIKLGADGVSVHVNLGAREERTMLKDLGTIAKEAMEWGMPLLAMMYARGPKIKNEYDAELVKHAARIGAELGADLVKVVYTGSPESFRSVVEACFVPVLIAGGEKMANDQDILEMVRGAMMAGGAGVSIGRNVFQHPDPSRMVRTIAGLVHGLGQKDER